jgi:hypothetical protein
MKATKILNPITAMARGNAERQPITVRSTDVTRGARLHAIRSASVFVDSDVMEDYAEIDVALGQNLAGVILSVLSYHLGINPGGVHDDQITICAIRREDATLVELVLHIERTRRNGMEHIVLRKGEEMEIDNTTAQHLHAVAA